MSITKNDVDKYLSEVHELVNAGRYQISARQKNQDIFTDYVFSEADARNVILSLRAEDFACAVQNEHLEHKEEILHIFGIDIKLTTRFGGSEELVPLYIKFNKIENHYLIVISFHKQDYPLTYIFK